MLATAKPHKMSVNWLNPGVVIGILPKLIIQSTSLKKKKKKKKE